MKSDEAIRALGLADLPKWGDACTRERCAACERPSPISFSVPNEVWEAVVHPYYRNAVLCVWCFISRADEKFIAWDEVIDLYPVSLRTVLNRRLRLANHDT